MTKVTAPEVVGPRELRLHLALVVDEQRGEVLVGVVRDARRGDALQELDGGELGRQLGHVPVDQGAQWDALGKEYILKNILDYF